MSASSESTKVSENVRQERGRWKKAGEGTWGLQGSES